MNKFTTHARFSRLIGLIIGFFLAFGTQAQAPTYKIFNDSDFVLYFDTLDPGRGTWKQQVINPHQGTQYQITSGSTEAKIRIGTPNRGYVEYQIGAGGVYNLRWDKNKNMWDVKADKQADAQARSNPVPNSLPYRLGDAVQVSWKGKWYRATVIQLSQNKTKIHYDGYGNEWDEWVSGDRIRYR